MVTTSADGEMVFSKQENIMEVLKPTLVVLVNRNFFSQYANFNSL